MGELLLKDEVYRIVGAAIEVYNEIGNGFLEAVYQECLGIEFAERGIPYEFQKDVRLHYKHAPLKKKYRADFIAYDSIIVEIKATERLIDEDQAQMINYLNAMNLQVEVLINFGARNRLEWKRMVLTGQKNFNISTPDSRKTGAL